MPIAIIVLIYHFLAVTISIIAVTSSNTEFTKYMVFIISLIFYIIVGIIIKFIKRKRIKQEQKFERNIMVITSLSSVVLLGWLVWLLCSAVNVGGFIPNLQWILYLGYNAPFIFLLTYIDKFDDITSLTTTYLPIIPFILLLIGYWFGNLIEKYIE